MKTMESISYDNGGILGGHQKIGTIVKETRGRCEVEVTGRLVGCEGQRRRNELK
jgi:hypothetical protein